MAANFAKLPELLRRGFKSADVRFEATAIIGCVSSETARSRMPRSGQRVSKVEVSIAPASVRFVFSAQRSSKLSCRERERGHLCRLEAGPANRFLRARNRVGVAA